MGSRTELRLPIFTARVLYSINVMSVGGGKETRKSSKEIERKVGWGGRIKDEIIGPFSPIRQTLNQTSHVILYLTPYDNLKGSNC